MPQDLFSAPPTPAVSPAKRRVTLVCSTILHVAILAVVVAVPLASGIAGPDVLDNFDTVLIADQPPPPPPAPHAGTPATTPSANAVPTASPDILAPEREPARPASPGVLGGLDVPSSGVLFGSSAPEAILPPPPPKPKDPVRPGGDIREPSRTVYVEPVYPQIALLSHVEGTVILEAIIDETGAVTHVKVLRSIPLLDRAAIEAVSHWRYSPTRLNGVPVSIKLTVTVMFTLRHETR